MSLPNRIPPLDLDLEALRERRVDAVERWFETYADAIYSFVLYRVGQDPSLAADVCQDTFVAALERIEAFDPQRGEMFPWLTYQARNCIRKALRQEARYDTGGDLWQQLDTRLAATLAVIDETPLPPEVLERDETRELVRVAVSNLPFRYQRALNLRYFEHRSIREIADAEGTSGGAIKALLHRARLAFRAAFGAISETLANDDREEGVF